MSWLRLLFIILAWLGLNSPPEAAVFIKPNTNAPFPGITRGVVSSTAGGGGGVAFTTVDWLVRMGVGNGNTPTVAELESVTFGLATGTWTKVGLDNNWIADTSQDAFLPGLGLSGGSGSGDPTTICFSWDPIVGGANDYYPLFTWTSAKSVICYGFALRMSAFSGKSGIYNIARSDTSGGEFFSCSIEQNDTVFNVRAHCGAADGALITGLTTDTWWWITMKRDATTSARLRVYSLPGLVQKITGTAESVGTLGASSTTCTALRVGRTDPTNPPMPAGVLMWDDFCARFADVHPLLPTP